jgi:hypothetical protein
MFLGEVVSFCKTIYLNLSELSEATGVVGVLLIAAVGMIHLVQARSRPRLRPQRRRQRK